MKLKNYAIFLAIITVIEIVFLAINSRGVPLTKITISNIGSLSGNYLFYLVATSLLFVMLASFLHQLYRSLGRTPRIEVYIIPVLAIIALFFKAPAVPSLGEWIHTIIFVIISGLILFIIYDLNKIIANNDKIDKNIFLTPKIAFYGTIGAFIIIGLNIFTEIVYISAILSWMHLIGGAISS